ncbi:hypothetical protein EMMF5_002527 [Cystobasidiomycetes sp. EMM_F5]
MYGGYDGQRGPPRAGIGAQGAAQNVAPANLAAAPTASSSGERYSLFLSGIPIELSDKRLHDVLETVGYIVKINRMRDAAGKPKAFGFVEYGDAEHVLRALELLNGITLIGQNREQKTLTVKADAKVRARLDEYETSRMKDSRIENQTAFAKDQLDEILAAIRKNPTEGQDDGEEELNADGTRSYRVPAHLQDLAPGDLPEESRGLITREIAFFRESAAKREAAAKQAEDKRQREKLERDEPLRRSGPPSGPSVPSSGRQPLPAQGSQYSSRADSPRNDQRGRFGSQASPPPRSASSDPMGRFVPSSANGPPSGPSGSVLSDEDAERLRQQRQHEDNERQYRQRLSRWEAREKTKSSQVDRDRQSKHNETQADERRRLDMLARCRNFDDDEEAENGNEAFIVDRYESILQSLLKSAADRCLEISRMRWRNQRRQASRREREQDQRDAELEAEEAERLKQESDQFLARQAEMFASMSASSSKPEGSGEPTKLKLVGSATVDTRAEEKLKAKAPAIFTAADEDDEDRGKKKRELIPLSYSDDEDEDTKAQKKQRKLKDLVGSIPNDKNGLWKYNVHWEQLNENIIRNKIQPFVAKKCVEYLGSEEEELISAVIDNMNAHKGPADLAEEVEPVLAEEAEEFVIKVYRHLIFELLSALHGIKI